MKREPWILYGIRLLLTVGLFALMAMLYWSSLLVEEDLKGLQEGLREVKSELYELRTEVGSLPTQGLSDVPAKGEKTTYLNPNIDPSFSNLLEEDPFYTTTLPEMLGDNFAPRGALRGARIGKPESLHPFSGWREINTWYDLCVGNVMNIKFGIYETLAPGMAVRIEERPRRDKAGKEFWIFLRDDVFWQPLKQSFFPDGPTLAPIFLRKHQLTAYDFKFYFDAMMNPSNQEAGAVSRRVYLEGLDEIEVIDDFTFVAKWSADEVTAEDGTTSYKVRYSAPFATGDIIRPLPRFVYQRFADGSKIIEDDAEKDTYRTNSVWAQNFAQHWAKNVIVSCGAWVFDGMSDREIRFRRNPDHHNRYAALVRERVTTFRNSPDSVWQDFKVVQSDIHGLAPEQIAEYEEFIQSPLYQQQAEMGKGIKKLIYMGNSFTYIGWNEVRPQFESKFVRQALTMAIDRKRIIDLYLQGLGEEVTGTFSQFSPAYNKEIKPWPFDPLRARELLEDEGWYDSDGDGVIDKEIDGQTVPFRFALTYYVKNPTGKAISEYISTALKEVGIDCELNGVDIADLSQSFDAKTFDAIALGWALGSPPENPGQLWHSSAAKEPGSSNAIGFANAEVDSIIESLLYEEDKTKRIQLYHRFAEIIHEEAPYTFLYTPKVRLLYREYVENVFIPSERQDLIPGANVFEPSSTVFWLSEPKAT